MTTLLELAKKLHNTLALYNGAGHALGWKTEKVDKLLDESKRVIELAEQPAQQEPVAWVCYGAPGKRDIDFEEADINGLPIGTSLYTSPPAQRTWVDLTFAEICECENDYLHIFARAIEAKLKEKNT